MSSTTSAPPLELQQRSQQQPHRITETHAEPVSSHLNPNALLLHNTEFEQYLEPADRGLAAWRLLGAAFVFEALLWGKSLISQS